MPKKEQGVGAHLGLKARVQNLELYDVVFAGYPVWWYTLLMSLFTFFESRDLSGKIVVAFCAHG